MPPQVAEKLRLLVQRTSSGQPRLTSLEVTVSIGIAGGQGKTLRAESLVRDADQAMYSAKSLGRNQTYVFAEPNDDARVPSAPISAAGRARAMEVAAVARQATEAALSDVIAPLPALPRSAVRPDRHDRRGHRQRPEPAGQRDRTDPDRFAPPRHRQDRRSRPDPREAERAVDAEWDSSSSTRGSGR